MRDGVLITIGNALEARAAGDEQPPPGLDAVDHAQGFEAGLQILVTGSAQQRHEPVRPA
ncbi:hypothetical protein [Amnibacterium kyonggiense]